jgi:hypothetical protein
MSLEFLGETLGNLPYLGQNPTWRFSKRDLRIDVQTTLVVSARDSSRRRLVAQRQE